MEKKYPVKTSKQLERHFKGIANHRRIDILFVIKSDPGISVEEVTEKLDANFKTISEHIMRLVHAGLVDKLHKGRCVTHKLSPYGKKIINLITTFQHS